MEKIERLAKYFDETIVSEEYFTEQDDSDKGEHLDNSYPSKFRDPDLDLLMSYLEDERKNLEREYDKPTIIDENDDIGKLMAIASEIQSLGQISIQELRLGKKKLPEHILIQNSAQSNILGLSLIHI